MIIRKQFKFEAAHRVRSSTGSRCKNSIHGHSYIAEVILVNDDDTDMVIDFGDLKFMIGGFMDSLDHATFLWVGDDIEYLDAMRKFSKRTVLMKRDPTAENMARAILHEVDNSLTHNNSRVDSLRVRIHETATGYAEADSFDPDMDVITVEHPNDD